MLAGGATEHTAPHTTVVLGDGSHIEVENKVNVSISFVCYYFFFY